MSYHSLQRRLKKGKEKQIQSHSQSGYKKLHTVLLDYVCQLGNCTVGSWYNKGTIILLSVLWLVIQATRDTIPFKPMRHLSFGEQQAGDWIMRN